MDQNRRNSISFSNSSSSSVAHKSAKYKNRRTLFGTSQSDHESNGSKDPTQKHFDSLMKDPTKKELLLKFISDNKKEIEEYKQREVLRKDVCASPIRKLQRKQQVESPTALLRRRALEKRDNMNSSPVSSITSGNSDFSAPPTVPYECLLKGVVAFVDVRSKNIDRSAAVISLCKSMGADVRKTFTNDVSHVIFKDGTFPTYHKAKLTKKFMVSILWLEATRTSKYRQPEKNYPALGLPASKPEASLLCDKFQKEYKSLLKDEIRRSSIVVPETPTPKINKSRYTYSNFQDVADLNKNSFFPEDDIIYSSDGEEYNDGSERLPSSPGSGSYKSVNFQEEMEESDMDSECGIIDGKAFRDSDCIGVILSESKVDKDSYKRTPRKNLFRKLESSPELNNENDYIRSTNSNIIDTPVQTKKPTISILSDKSLGEEQTKFVTVRKKKQYSSNSSNGDKETGLTKKKLFDTFDDIPAFSSEENCLAASIKSDTSSNLTNFSLHISESESLTSKNRLEITKSKSSESASTSKNISEISSILSTNLPTSKFISIINDKTKNKEDCDKSEAGTSNLEPSLDSKSKCNPENKDQSIETIKDSESSIRKCSSEAKRKSPHVKIDECMKTVKDSESSIKELSLEVKQKSQSEKKDESIETVKDSESSVKKLSLEAKQKSSSKKADESIETLKDSESSTKKLSLEAKQKSPSEKKDESIETVKDSESFIRKSSLKDKKKSQSEKKDESIETVKDSESSIRKLSLEAKQKSHSEKKDESIETVKDSESFIRKSSLKAKQITQSKKKDESIETVKDSESFIRKSSLKDKQKSRSKKSDESIETVKDSESSIKKLSMEAKQKSPSEKKDESIETVKDSESFIRKSSLKAKQNSQSEMKDESIDTVKDSESSIRKSSLKTKQKSQSKKKDESIGTVKDLESPMEKSCLGPTQKSPSKQEDESVETVKDSEAQDKSASSKKDDSYEIISGSQISTKKSSLGSNQISSPEKNDESCEIISDSDSLIKRSSKVKQNSVPEKKDETVKDSRQANVKSIKAVRKSRRLNKEDDISDNLLSELKCQNNTPSKLRGKKRSTESNEANIAVSPPKQQKKNNALLPNTKNKASNMQKSINSASSEMSLTESNSEVSSSDDADRKKIKKKKRKLYNPDESFDENYKKQIEEENNRTILKRRENRKPLQTYMLTPSAKMVIRDSMRVNTSSTKCNASSKDEYSSKDEDSSDDSLVIGLLNDIANKKQVKKRRKTKKVVNEDLDEQKDLLKEFEKVLDKNSDNSDELDRDKVEPTKITNINPFKTPQGRPKRTLRKVQSQVVNTITSTSNNRRSSLEFQSKRTPTPKKLQKTQKPTIVCTRFHREEIKMCNEVVERLGRFEVEKNVTDRTTHLVVGELIRTVNMLKAIGRGLWLVSKDWLLKSQEKGMWLPEEDFEVVEFSPAVQKSRIQRESFGPKYPMDIFAACGSIYIAKSVHPNKADLEDLVRICKGKIESIPRNASIVVGEHLRYEQKSYIKEMWILDCITANRTLKFNAYEL